MEKFKDPWKLLVPSKRREPIILLLSITTQKTGQLNGRSRCVLQTLKSWASVAYYTRVRAMALMIVREAKLLVKATGWAQLI
jgi:hypothetical protein